jgi:hypothetical protein
MHLFVLLRKYRIEGALIAPAQLAMPSRRILD